MTTLQQPKDSTQTPHDAYPSDSSSVNLDSSTSQNHVSDPTFVTEQNHLTHMYQLLSTEYDELEQQMKRAHTQATEDLANMASEVRQNFGSDDEAMETYAAIETLNAVIDAYNQKHDFDADRLKRLAILLLQPYFAKVVLQMRPHAPAREVYIGSVGITDKNNIPLIVDWRSPVAQTYYNQEMGKTSYEVNGKRREVELKLRRQYDIVRDRLKAYFDSEIAIEDALLLRALSEHHSEKLKAITATIQREQNEIIRMEDTQATLIEGIAGSGKTSVLLQRLAYLLYQHKDTLTSDDVYLFAPNDVFRHYIDMVLPQLGEKNPHSYTWKSFITSKGFGTLPEGRQTTLADLEHIKQACEHLSFSQRDLQEITLHDVVLLKASSIQGAIEKFLHVGIGRRLITLVKDELHTRLDKRIANLAQTEDIQEHMASLDIDAQMEVFNEVISPQNDEETLKYAKIYAHYLFDEAHKAIDHVLWLNFAHMAQRLCGSSTPTSVEALYLQLLLCGSSSKNAKYVLIDEVQDYTPAQIYVLAQAFERAHLIFAGDEHQAITTEHTTFSELIEVCEKLGKTPEHKMLTTSFRSTPEITHLFWSLFENTDKMHISSVQLEGRRPQFVMVDENDSTSYVDVLQNLIRTREANHLMAIIARDTRRAKWIAKQLKEREEKVAYIDASSILPKKGVVVMTLSLAKGLEFDHVIIPDAQESCYPADTASDEREKTLSQRCLYTAISRATHKIDIVSQGKITSLLENTDLQVDVS